MNNYEINKGEIWEVDNNGSTRLVVVLACFERYAATVMLQDTEPGSNAVAIKARDLMYADAGRLGYVFYDKMVDFVRELNHEELAYLRQAINDALSLGTAPEAETAAADLEAAQQEITILREDLAKAQEEIDNQAEELETAANRVAGLEEEKKAAAAPVQGFVELKEEYSLREDLAAARREAEVYKGLYEAMLARALG